MNNCNCIRCAESKLEGAESYLDMVGGQLGWGGPEGTPENYRQARIDLVRAQEDLEWSRYLTKKEDE